MPRSPGGARGLSRRVGGLLGVRNPREVVFLLEGTTKAHRTFMLFLEFHQLNLKWHVPRESETLATAGLQGVSETGCVSLSLDEATVSRAPRSSLTPLNPWHSCPSGSALLRGAGLVAPSLG